MNGMATLSTEQVLTGGDSGFSEIEMNTSIEEANVDHLPSFDDAHMETPIPGSSNFNSRSLTAVQFSRKKLYTVIVRF